MPVVVEIIMAVVAEFSISENFRVSYGQFLLENQELYPVREILVDFFTLIRASCSLQCASKCIVATVKIDRKSL